MSEWIKELRVSRWPHLHSCAVLFLLLYFMVWPVNFYLADSIYHSYYPLLVPVLVAFYYYFRRLRDGIEVKLMSFYCLWIFVSRLLNRDFALTQDLAVVMDLSLCAVTLPVGFLLNRQGRDRMLYWFGGLLGAFCFVMGLIGIAASVQGKLLINPITEGYLAGMVPFGPNYRLNVLDTSPNVSALWFFLSFCMMLWLFAKCRHPLLRILIALSALVDHVTIALTYSRNVKLVFSVAVAMVLMLLVLRRGSARPKKLLALILVLVILLAVPLSYMSFQGATGVIGQISERIQEPRPEAEPTAQSFNDKRTWSEDSGRLDIFRSAITTLQREPLRLLRGCLTKNVMSIANQVLPRAKVHFHNTYLQVLIFAGLPGLLLVLGFCVFLLWRMLRIFFSREAAFSLKLLVIPLAGSLLYNMLEVDLFFDADVRTLSFYLLAGILLSYYYEFWPEEKRRIHRNARNIK